MKDEYKNKMKLNYQKHQKVLKDICEHRDGWISESDAVQTQRPVMWVRGGWDD